MPSAGIAAFRPPSEGRADVVELQPQTVEWLLIFLSGVATGGLVTSGLALGVSLWLRAWVEKPATKGGKDAVS